MPEVELWPLAAQFHWTVSPTWMVTFCGVNFRPSCPTCTWKVVAPALSIERNAAQPTITANFNFIMPLRLARRLSQQKNYFVTNQLHNRVWPLEMWQTTRAARGGIVGDC